MTRRAELQRLLIDVVADIDRRSWSQSGDVGRCVAIRRARLKRVRDVVLTRLAMMDAMEVMT